MVNETVAFALIDWLVKLKLFLDSIHEEYFFRVVYQNSLRIFAGPILSDKITDVYLKSFSHHVLWRIFRPFQRGPNRAFFYRPVGGFARSPHGVLGYSCDSSHIGS